VEEPISEGQLVETYTNRLRSIRNI